MDEDKPVTQGEEIELQAARTEVGNFDSGKDTDYQEALDYLTVEYTPEQEKKVVRKLDLHIVTYVSALYLLSFLDRGNIGNAYTAGMGKDIGLSDGQYQWLLTIFYISYILFQWMILCWKVLPVKIYVPCVVILWGIVSTCFSAAQNWATMMALRFILGIFEAAFGPGVPYYLTFFYYRREVAWRTGIFLSVSPFASAFSGALAYGITSHYTAIAGWRVLFLAEGLPTIVVGAIGFYAIQSSAETCRFLTSDEKLIAAARTVRQLGHVKRDHKLIPREVFLSLLDVKNWCPMLIFFCLNVSFSSLPVYLPSFLKGMGYTSIQAQGMSAPPYLFTTLLVLATSWYSDKLKQRGYFLMGLSALSATGYLILSIVDVTGVKYFATFLCAGGVFPCIPLLISWLGNNQGSDTKKGVGFVLLQVVGQCGPLLGTRLFPASEAPHYRKGFYISFGFMCGACILTILLRSYLAYENEKLDKRYGPVPDDLEQTEHAVGMEQYGNQYFRYIL